MKISNLMKGALVASAVMVCANSFAQIQDEKNVTVTMELVPVLQLNMNTPDQVNFVFDEIYEYMGGITKYGATYLTVSSSVNWDLFASGTSVTHQGTATNRWWDAVTQSGSSPVVTTGEGAYNRLPLTALELRQYPNTAPNVNDGADQDHVNYYFPAFAPAQGAPVLGQNNIHVSPTSNPYLPPIADGKYLAGGAGVEDYVNGGSYLATTDAAGTSAYYYIIDYRIVPGLPAQFPHAANGSIAIPASEALSVSDPGAYAKPGVYTMNVKYLLIENQ